jgi:deoxyribodipyrimidine photo-lyase
LVDLTLATRAAKTRLHDRRKHDDVRAGKQAVIEKHASRKTFASRRRQTKNQTPDTAAQLGFDF